MQTSSRSRKVKCNGSQPCDRCQAANIPCEFSGEQKRRGPDKQPGTRRRRTKAQKQHDDLVAMGLLPPSTTSESGSGTSHSAPSRSRERQQPLPHRLGTPDATPTPASDLAGPSRRRPPPDSDDAPPTNFQNPDFYGDYHPAIHPATPPYIDEARTVPRIAQDRDGRQMSVPRVNEASQAPHEYHARVIQPPKVKGFIKTRAFSYPCFIACWSGTNISS